MLRLILKNRGLLRTGLDAPGQRVGLAGLRVTSRSQPVGSVGTSAETHGKAWVSSPRVSNQRLHIQAGPTPRSGWPPSQLGSQRSGCVRTEVQAPAFCLKWETGCSSQERSPLSGGQAGPCRRAELAEREGGRKPSRETAEWTGAGLETPLGPRGQ